jgi:hypothetical protein
MINWNFELQPEIEEKMQLILDQYPDKESFFQDIINNQVNELMNGIHNIEIDLKEFEKKYQRSTEDFFRQFKNGELDDRNDFIVWSGIYEMQLENKRKLAELE